ncbi:PLAC8 family-domain-containing protein [Russula vinacea]|nr:PLAC8 family-domain-containing protein [Russula vinacea]
MQVGGNRNAKNCPVDADGKRDWSFGLFDCFGRCGLCCWSTWCPCVVYSKNKQRLRSLQIQGAPLDGGGEAYDDQCCVYGALDIDGKGWVMEMQTRAELRERYGIRGDGIGDCFALWCCRPCSLTQERREIELEENSFY